MLLACWKIMAVTMLAAISLGATLLPAAALSLPKVDHAATLKECGSCHMVYPPQLLPQRSWDALMGKLDSHFGENATLDDATRVGILAYLLAHAADAPGTATTDALSGIDVSAVPDRITSLPWWLGRHEEVNMANIKATRVKTAANCVGCHTGAGEGSYSE